MDFEFDDIDFNLDSIDFNLDFGEPEEKAKEKKLLLHKTEGI